MVASPIRSCLCLLAAMLVAALGPGSTLGHAGSGPALVLTSEALRPGALLEVTGSDFDAGVVVRIDLVAGGTDHALSAVRSGGDGHFFDAVRLPIGVSGGVWEVRATDEAGRRAVARLVVEAPLAAPGRTAASSGSSSALEVVPMGLLAAMLIVLGAVALRTLRRGDPRPAG